MKMLLMLILIFSLPVLAQEETPTAAGPPSPCSSETYRQFDFWIGDWNVTADGQQAGSNSIKLIHNGCALMENWQGSGAGGISGSSFSMYDRARGTWHQTWVDGNGTLLLLDGGWQDGGMVMYGERPAQEGPAKTAHRIKWTPQPNGTVHQLWEASKNGQSWIVLFDGIYTKASARK